MPSKCTTVLLFFMIIMAVHGLGEIPACPTGLQCVGFTSKPVKRCDDGAAGTCTFRITVTEGTDKSVTFKTESTDDTKYIAVALSNDKKMAGSLVAACIHISNTNNGSNQTIPNKHTNPFYLSTGYTTPAVKITAEHQILKQFKELGREDIDGVQTCTFQFTFPIDYNELKIPADPEYAKLQFLVAVGPYDPSKDPSVLKHNSGRINTDNFFKCANRTTGPSVACGGGGAGAGAGAGAGGAGGGGGEKGNNESSSTDHGNYLEQSWPVIFVLVVAVLSVVTGISA